MDGPSLVPVDGGSLEVEVTGEGDPLVVVSTALDPTELRPLARQLARRHRVAHVVRRGYAGSSPAPPGRTVEDDAADVAAVIEALGWQGVHVVGASYSAAVALRTATSSRVGSVTAIETPPAGTPSALEFVEANRRLLAAYDDLGGQAALEAFMAMLAGEDWRSDSERLNPGSVAAVEAGCETFFTRDVPALLRWEYDGPADATPVLVVRGSETGPWFAEMHERLARWGTAADPVPGGEHSVALTHAAEVAGLVTGHRG